MGLALLAVCFQVRQLVWGGNLWSCRREEAFSVTKAWEVKWLDHRNSGWKSELLELGVVAQSVIPPLVGGSKEVRNSREASLRPAWVTDNIVSKIKIKSGSLKGWPPCNENKKNLCLFISIGIKTGIISSTKCWNGKRWLACHVRPIPTVALSLLIMPGDSWCPPPSSLPLSCRARAKAPSGYPTCVFGAVSRQVNKEGLPNCETHRHNSPNFEVPSPKACHPILKEELERWPCS